VASAVSLEPPSGACHGGRGPRASGTLAAGHRPRGPRRSRLGGGRGPGHAPLARNPAPPCHPLGRISPVSHETRSARRAFSLPGCS